MGSTGSSGIRRLLVANRGEIARRVFATCRRLGIETVAVHSDADSALPFVGEADRAVRLPGHTPADTYLRADLILDAARRAGADAIHPGYGFLSENADFARAVRAAGLTWVGPAPESIQTMGDKVRSKTLMAGAGVPVLDSLDPAAVTAADLPVLVKASAGGGGRGMRVVRGLADLATEIAKAQAEAASAFGDGTVFVEPYVEHGRHVEVQIWGDFHGTNVSVLGARDCSIQRRHQKVVEEAPPPGLTAETLDAMYAAARAAGHAISYVGAGTVEFLVDAQDTSRFWFLEMNTRLQVEHPVTEAVSGIDLVELQIKAAEDPTALGVSSSGPHGHAIEVRLYAEDPAADWQPQSGTLAAFDIPGVSAEFARSGEYGLRLDAGFRAGSEVSTHYDAMLAKLVSWGPDRASAARSLAAALTRARIHGLITNRALLARVLRSPEFLSGDVSTDFLERTGLHATDLPAEVVRAAAVAAAIALAEVTRADRVVQRGIPVAWRNVVSQPQDTRFVLAGDEVAVSWYGGRDGYRVEGSTVLAASPSRVRLESDGVAEDIDVTVGEPDLTGTREVHVDGPDWSVSLRTVARFTDPAAAVATGSLLAPMPGTVVRVEVEVGAEVEAGEPVLVLEAMKMQHSVAAPHAGVVTHLEALVGAQVAAGEVLAVVAAVPAAGTPNDDEGEPR